jgi:hypothetical protein
VALGTAAIAFEPRIKISGFNADDWALYATVKFPQIAGSSSVLGALEHAGGSRVGHMFYWLVGFSLFGAHARLYTVTEAALAVCLAFCVYLLLRELRFSIVGSLAMMALTLVAPSVETMRFWFTVGGLQIPLSLFCLGLMFGMRAFAAPPGRRLRLHAASWGLYLASAIYAETALPLIVAGGLVYLTRTRLISSLRRWAADMVIVVCCYIGTLVFVSTTAGFSGIPASMWSEHANLIAAQALTIFTKSLGPLSSANRTLGLVGVGALIAACLVLWRRGNIDAGARLELQRWGFALLVGAVAITLVYAVFVPAMLYYEPLGFGLATHINAATAIPLAVCIFSVLMLTRIVCIALLAGVIPRVAMLMTAAVVAWFGVIFVESIEGVRNDAHIWALASSRGYHVLNVLTADLPRPVHGSTVYTFGEAGTVAIGMPIFYTSWEQTSAVKVAYDRPDISSYPIVANGMQAGCTPQGVTVSLAGTAVNTPSAYGYSYFLDIPTRHFVLVKSASACAAELSRFKAGPYSDAAPLEWSL